MHRTKAFRRFHELIKKTKIKNLFKTIYHDSVLANDEKEVGKYTHTPHQCSCGMCCNKRNVNGCQKDKLSLQEKRSNLDLKEELNEDKENK
jgi:hypothetical protein